MQVAKVGMSVFTAVGVDVFVLLRRFHCLAWQFCAAITVVAIVDVVVVGTPSLPPSYFSYRILCYLMLSYVILPYAYRILSYRILSYLLSGVQRAGSRGVEPGAGRTGVHVHAGVLRPARR